LLEDLKILENATGFRVEEKAAGEASLGRSDPISTAAAAMRITWRRARRAGRVR
jgi:hypothetical protein